MNDEATRKFIQAIKRLMTFCQRRYPTDPSREPWLPAAAVVVAARCYVVLLTSLLAAGPAAAPPPAVPPWCHLGATHE